MQLGLPAAPAAAASQKLLMPAVCFPITLDPLPSAAARSSGPACRCLRCCSVLPLLPPPLQSPAPPLLLLFRLCRLSAMPPPLFAPPLPFLLRSVFLLLSVLLLACLAALVARLFLCLPRLCCAAALPLPGWMGLLLGGMGGASAGSGGVGLGVWGAGGGVLWGLGEVYKCPFSPFQDHLVLVPSTAGWPVIPNFPRSVASCLPSRKSPLPPCPRSCLLPTAPVIIPRRVCCVPSRSPCPSPLPPIAARPSRSPRCRRFPKGCSLPTVPVIAAFSCFPISHPQWSRRSLSLRLPSTAARPSRSPPLLALSSCCPLPTVPAIIPLSVQLRRRFPKAARFPPCQSLRCSVASRSPCINPMPSTAARPSRSPCCRHPVIPNPLGVLFLPVCHPQQLDPPAASAAATPQLLPASHCASLPELPAFCCFPFAARPSRSACCRHFPEAACFPLRQSSYLSAFSCVPGTLS